MLLPDAAAAAAPLVADDDEEDDDYYSMNMIWHSLSQFLLDSEINVCRIN